MSKEVSVRRSNELAVVHSPQERIRRLRKRAGWSALANASAMKYREGAIQ